MRTASPARITRDVYQTLMRQPGIERPDSVETTGFIWLGKYAVVMEQIGEGIHVEVFDLSQCVDLGPTPMGSSFFAGESANPKTIAVFIDWKINDIEKAWSRRRCRIDPIDQEPLGLLSGRPQYQYLRKMPARVARRFLAGGWERYTQTSLANQRPHGLFAWDEVTGQLTWVSKYSAKKHKIGKFPALRDARKAASDYYKKWVSKNRRYL